MRLAPIVVVGELTIDDVIVEGDRCDWKQPGGGALYSAIGAFLWHPEVAISALVGADYPATAVEALVGAGLNLDAVRRVETVNSLGLWLLYEASGRRHQVEKASGGSFAVIDELREPWHMHLPRAVAVHIAPQSSAGQLSALRDARQAGIPVSLDLLVEPFIDTGPYLDGRAWQGLDALLPSEQELRQLWGTDNPQTLRDMLREQARTPHLVIKRGPRGCDVVLEEVSWTVPSVCGTVIDPTGAGDAFCGGFLAGLVRAGDPVDAACYGAVSASFVVETRGALTALARLDSDEARRRLAEARRHTTRNPT